MQPNLFWIPKGKLCVWEGCPTYKGEHRWFCSHMHIFFNKLTDTTFLLMCFVQAKRSLCITKFSNHSCVFFYKLLPEALSICKIAPANAGKRMHVGPILQKSVAKLWEGMAYGTNCARTYEIGFSAFKKSKFFAFWNCFFNGVIFWAKIAPYSSGAKSGGVA